MARETMDTLRGQLAAKDGQIDALRRELMETRTETVRLRAVVAVVQAALDHALSEGSK